MLLQQIKKNPHALYGKDEAFATSCLREAFKCLYIDADGKSGCAGDWRQFLKEEKDGKKSHIINYHGTRYNAIFKQASAVFYHREDII